MRIYLMFSLGFLFEVLHSIFTFALRHLIITWQTHFVF